MPSLAGMRAVRTIMRTIFTAAIPPLHPPVAR
jgi:hypothetical protein